jgi:hypothetical protein
METTREQIESDILHQVRNEIQEALLRHASASWPDERLDEIEEEVLAHIRLVVESLSDSELKSSGASAKHLDQAVAEKMRLIRSGARRSA